MTEAGNTKGKCQIRQRVFAFLSKVAALLGLAALGFLLTRPALPVGWVVIAVVVIHLSLAYSPRSAASRAPVPVRSTDCRVTGLKRPARIAAEGWEERRTDIYGARHNY